ncbi:MAG: murein hydrolase activator [Hyphomicrobiales bacterium]|jgi:septal ring factor EnvC (AmiA/AmiB activator)|nr:murein hydrolase activator [Hyphomicrobiales bacterium]
MTPSAAGRLCAGALCASLFLLAAPGRAQQPLQITPAPATPATTSPAATAVAPEAAKGARQEELEKIQAEQKRAADLAARLKAELDSIGEDRRKLNALLIGSAANIRALEESIAAAEARLNALGNNENTVRRSLASRKAVIGEVLAALQRVGRHPPPALLVSPEDALQSVRTAILLGAVLPDMKVEVDTLVADLAELVKVRTEIAAEREVLGRDLAAVTQERSRMTVLVQERQRKQSETEKALDAERARSVQLARQADNLKDLIGRIEQEIASAARGAAAARADKPATDPKNSLAALQDPGRLSPAIAFASARKSLPLPLNGIRIREFGVPDGLGGTEKGLSIVSRAGAQVTAPCDGWVVYAGPFRSYGQLLILNAGGGYHVLLAGMERISVDLGQFVLTGEPVAIMGGGPQSAAAVATGSSQPVLYIEFRKDGSPVDPSPWWASDSEKVRG